MLLVDDEPKFLESISERIRLKGFAALPAESGEKALEIARKQSVDLAIVDQKMPGMDGLTTIIKLREIDPHIRTVLLTGYGNDKLREAAEALDAPYFEKDKMRAFWDFIRQYGEKSGRIIVDPRTGSVEMAPAGGKAGSQQDTARAEVRRHSLPPLQRLIGETPDFLALKENIRKVAFLNCPVLIIGERGTGKEMVARAIHAESGRTGKSLVVVDCGAFTEELLISELFGYNVATGDDYRKTGVFEYAAGGTVFFEGVDQAPPSVQSRLERLLIDNALIDEDRKKAVPLNVRILAAATEPLEARVERGDFSEGLYQRLNAYSLKVPALRERLDDIPLLSSYFLDLYREKFHKPIQSVSGEVVAVFQRYSFPGNVRELESALEHAVILCETTEIEKEHLPQRFWKNGFSSGAGGGTDFVSLAELEDRYILEVMRATGGNKSEAARILGINRASLWRKLKKRRLLMDHSQQIRLLIVDDDEKFLNTIAERLGLKDFYVTTATDGSEALEAAEQGVFDVAIVDLNMPGMKGKELLKTLKEKNRFLEVVILTGYASIDSAVECMKLGAFGYLEKPYDFENLLGKLKEAYEARLRKKFEQNAKRLAEIESLSVGSSPLSILRNLKQLDDDLQ